VIGSFLPIGDCCIGRLDGKSRMSGDAHVRICERVGVRLPRAPRLVVLCNGTKAQAEALREELHDFLKSDLKLNLSLEKTKVTHLNDGFKYLGFWLQRKTGQKGMTTKVLIPREATDKVIDKITKATDPGTYQDSANATILALNRSIGGWFRYTSVRAKPPSPSIRWHILPSGGWLIGSVGSIS
jgi:hypothetical protein